MLRTFALAATLALTTVATTSPAIAQNVTADPKVISAILREQNFWATIEADKQGDPLIEATFEQGTKFRIYFYGCEKNANCTSIQFVAAFTDTKAGAAEMVKWNTEYRFARAYLDSDGDAVIEMDLNLDEGGISRALFVDNLDLWDAILGHYSDLLYPEEAKDPAPAKI
ncbi:YbjN domain-containing protein [Sphingomonas sp. ST-64]|uniref:YbjN domain-containing protein n=1 Tax=Sphingomonas plantiphila TaxID=3163295 RepID=A0ABW8YPV3_9SPHN